MRSEAKGFHGTDEPFSGIILVPFNGVAVVHGELVVKIVVSLANRDDGGDEMIARGMLVIKGCLAKVMGETVYAER